MQLFDQLPIQRGGVLCLWRNITHMAYEVEVSDEFKDWYEDTLSEPEQNSVERVVLMLIEAGPALGFPQSRWEGLEIQSHAGAANPARRPPLPRTLCLRSNPDGFPPAGGR